MVCSFARFADGTHGFHVGMGVVLNRQLDITIVCNLAIVYLSFQLINGMPSLVKYGGSLLEKIGGDLYSTRC